MSYAIVWSEGGGPVHAGRLELADRCLLLEGTAPLLPELRRRIAYGELTAVSMERRRQERLGGCPTVVLERRAGPALRVASVEGAGTLHELAERLAGLLTRAAA